jgi:hypothetical protein
VCDPQILVRDLPNYKTNYGLEVVNVEEMAKAKTVDVSV